MIVCSAGAGLSLAYLSFSVKLGFFYSDAFLCPYAFVACSRWFCPCFYFFMAVFALVMQDCFGIGLQDFQILCMLGALCSLALLASVSLGVGTLLDALFCTLFTRIRLDQISLSLMSWVLVSSLSLISSFLSLISFSLQSLIADEAILTASFADATSSLAFLSGSMLP